MSVTKEVLIKELMWEYDYTEEKALLTYDLYFRQGNLEYLYQFLQEKRSLIIL